MSLIINSQYIDPVDQVLYEDSPPYSGDFPTSNVVSIALTRRSFTKALTHKSIKDFEYNKNTGHLEIYVDTELDSSIAWVDNNLLSKFSEDFFKIYDIDCEYRSSFTPTKHDDFQVITFQLTYK